MAAHTSDKVSQAREDLERAVAALRDSAAWKRNLVILARFHRYSWHNQLLIGCQCPEASFVRGFKAWLDLGRAVRKGERGIHIFAPRPWERAAEDDDAEPVRGVSFTVVHVFDVSQTDPIPGHPRPWEPPALQSATGDDSVAWGLWDALMTHAGALGLTVSTAEGDKYATRDMGGYYYPAAKSIWVRPGRERAGMAATLAHELAHAVTHDATEAMSRGAREVIAESVAYAVCSRFGLNMTLRSAQYVASWLDDPEAFRVGMAAIHSGATSLIDAVDAALTADALPNAA